MEIRLYHDSDEEKLLSLLQVVFDGWHGPTYWEWLYKRNPQGRLSVAIATEDDRILASYSVCPAAMSFGGATLPVGFGIDAATHPSFRRKGLFEQVAKAAFADAEQRGFRFILGYSEWGGAAATGQVQKLGFSRVFDVKRLVKVLNWPRAIAFKLNVPLYLPDVDLVVEEITRNLSKARDRALSMPSRDNLDTDSFTPNRDDCIILHKSLKYIQWRYYDHPEKRYLIFSIASHGDERPAVAVLTLRHEKRINVAVIVDIFGNQTGWSPLLSGLEKILASSGISLIEAYLSNAHDATKLLTLRGYRDRAYSLVGILRTTSNAKSDHVKLASSDQSWQTTLGDDASL